MEENHVSGWDDPRMPTLVGMRRRGYTAGALQLLAERTGATKNNTWIDYAWLDIALRDDLEAKAARAMAVLDPIPLKLTNWADVFGAAATEPCSAPAHPHHPEMGQREFVLGPQVWIERDDFLEVQTKGYQRLFPGNKVRLKYGVDRRVHRLREGRRRQGHGRARHRRARHEERHAGRRPRQGQGHDHLGGRARRRARHAEPVRPPVRRAAAGLRRQS